MYVVPLMVSANCNAWLIDKLEVACWKLILPLAVVNTNTGPPGVADTVNVVALGIVNT